MMYRGFRMFGGGGIVGVILLLIVAYFLIRYFKENQNTFNKSTPKEKHDALEILDQRYAQGEIDEEEYKRKKEILKGKR
jgi:putative membrane protein